MDQVERITVRDTLNSLSVTMNQHKKNQTNLDVYVSSRDVNTHDVKLKLLTEI